MEVFRRKDGYVRYSTSWYYIGRSPEVYWRNCNFQGTTYFWGSLRKAPIHITHFNHVGIWKEVPTRMPALYFTGSQVDPYHSWHLRLGRVFLGGVTPRALIKSFKRFQRWHWLKEAKRTGEGLCPKCKNGLIMYIHGHPGEYLDMCDNRKCGHVVDTYFAKWEIE